MLEALRAQNVALIRDASIEPARGLTVLTGETGTGKTALLSAVKLAVGERADATSVREGADALEVEALFYLGPDDLDGTVVRRRLSSDGRGRATIDGAMASVRELAERIGSTVDLCGQHEHQRLLSASTHVELLDAWAGDDAAAAHSAYTAALDDAHRAAEELEEVRALMRASDERLADAQFALRRIGEVNPREGEYELLCEELPVAEHAEQLLQSAEAACEALSGDEGALDAVGSAHRMLEMASVHDRSLATFASSLDDALATIEDVARDLRSYCDRMDIDEAELARMQARYSAFQGLLRSFGPDMESVFARKAAAEQVVAAVQGGGEHERAALAAVDAAETSLAEAAAHLDAVRRAAAPDLCAAITAQMARLEMGGAEVEVAFEELPRSQWTGVGPSRIELLYRPAAGMAARPLRRIASGGEISRVMLATKVVLGAADAVDTLVFDEVDAGVGGATAVALAAVLADLARTHQVIVVTHLAQVAARAERHYVVEKTADALPETIIREVAGDERVREIARMLSGDATEASLAHAREMLDA